MLLEIGSHAEFAEHLGKEIGVSDYHKITQEQINLFADATLDHQWIHVDEEKAKAGQFGATIAHGYLTLSLLPHLWGQILKVSNVKSMINYGIEKMKFNQPVLVNSEVRIRVKLVNIMDLRGITKAELNVVMEIKDSAKSAYEANIIFLYHFNK